MAWRSAQQQAVWRPSELAPGGLPAERAERGQTESDAIL